ncbi:MAG TPA: hypothetical protein V6D22_19040 [Candidatus Obscuribacterales bacterium]
MTVTALEPPQIIRTPEYRLHSRCSFPLKILGAVNGVIAGGVIVLNTMPGIVQDCFDAVALPSSSFIRHLDVREPAYMAFALAWLMAVIYKYVDEINENRFALYSADQSETIHAFTIEDLFGHLIRAVMLLVPALGLYFLPEYLHRAAPLDHLAFVIVFALQFLLWRQVRRRH